MTANELRIIIREILQGIENYKEEVDIIISHFTGLSRTGILLGDQISDESANDAKEAALKRKFGRPLQYILGECEFYGSKFIVGEGVLIPRPETEILIDVVLKNEKEIGLKVADLCSGTGCIGITLKKNLKSSIVSVFENSKLALKYLNLNANKLNSKVKIYDIDILDKTNIEKDYKFDIITANPPYLNKEEMESLQKEVGFEPTQALYGGDDGLKFYKEIVPLWEKTLNRGGRFYFEIGYLQEKDVIDILKNNKMVDINSFKDYNNIIRVITAKKK